MRNRRFRWELLVYVLVTLLPLLSGLGYSLLYSFGLLGILPSGFTISYWREIFSSNEVVSSFALSISVASLSLLLSVAGALAFTIRNRDRLTGGARSTIFYFPLAIPAVVGAFLTFQFFSRSGLFSRIAYQLGWISDLNQFPDLINDTLCFGIIATHVLLAMPFFVILFANLFESERLEELAQVATSLGATSRQVKRTVLIPVLLRRALPVVVLYFLFVLGSYEIPLLLGRQSPQMISVLAIHKLQRFNLLDRPIAYIIALLYMCFAGGIVAVLLGRKRESAYER